MDAQEYHDEHIRRLAEVAHILLDVGLILIVSAVELTPADMDLVRTVLNGVEIMVVWVGNRNTTGVTSDLQVNGADAPEFSARQIRSLLEERGVIFRA